MALYIFVGTSLGQADQNSIPDFNIHEGKNDRLPLLNTTLPRYVQVFGLFIQATSRVPKAKLLHAADIASDLLDNNRDGKPDNPKGNEELWNQRSTVIMGYDERELERLHDRLGTRVDDYALQGLFATETLPKGGPHNPNSLEFDASIEEILHIITSIGYAEVYPEVFGERKGSELAKAMDTARGGYFRTVPQRYPSEAWYSYDDRTCNYSCQVTEYVYWALTSLLDGQDFKNRGRDIHHEWKLNTPKKIRAKDKAVVKILTKPKYKLPTRLPDGKYRQAIKRLSVKLNTVTKDNRVVLNSVLPPGTSASLETSADLRRWIIAQHIDVHKGIINMSVDIRPTQAQFFRLRLGE